MGNRLDFLLRKNKGDKMLSAYKGVFLQSGFKTEELTYVNLEDTDKVMNILRSMANRVRLEYEVISGDCRNVECSKLLNNMHDRFGEEQCYIYIDNYEYCGMFLCRGKIALENALNMAFNDGQHSCFILNVNYKYAFLVNYGDIENFDFPNEFDIQHRTWDKICS